MAGQKKLEKKPRSLQKFQTKLDSLVDKPQNHSTLLNVVGATSIEKVGGETTLATFQIAVNDQEKCKILLDALSNNPDTKNLFFTKIEENIGKMNPDQVANTLKSVHEVHSNLESGEYKDELRNLERIIVRHAIETDMKIDNRASVKYAIDILGYDESQTLKAMHKKNMKIDGISVMDWALNEGRQIDGVSMELKTFSQKASKDEGKPVLGKHTQKLRDEPKNSLERTFRS